MIKEGDAAPAFELEGSDGKRHKLSDYKGKNVVLYFYPKDNTPGCTIEAKEFSSKISDIRSIGADVLGISKDDFTSHCDFVSKHKLAFILLSDPSSNCIKKYGAYGDRGVFGKGTLRKTFIIDKTGKIAKVFGKVNPIGHAEEVITALRDI
jgi:peroxiredoxin Q/BCP